MSLETDVAFRTIDTGFDEGDFTLTLSDFDTGADVLPGTWTLTHRQRGIYRLYIDSPSASARCIWSLVHNTTPTISADGSFNVSGLTPQAIWEYTDRSLTTVDEGAGSVLYTWTEYESGHNNDPNYGVSDVTVHVFSNDLAVGAPVAKGVTDETGTVVFYLDPGTYYLWRRKTGRKFTNPATVEVNFGGNTDQTPEDPNEIAFTWTEYETGHADDPAYVIPHVWIRAYTNNRAAGTPTAYGTTGESGSVVFYLAAGTYYLFRYKSGRVFNNPFTIEVS